MSEYPKIERGLFILVTGLLGWVVPGAGYLMIKEWKRATFVFVMIVATFLTGIYIGSIGVIDSAGAKPWYMGQLLTSPAVAIIAEQAKDYVPVYGKPCEVGQIYTAVAGLLNLLALLSAMYMAYCGRGEMIGQEEEDA